MHRNTLARRYAPLALLAAVQLLIIATVPSIASKGAAAQVSSGGSFAPGSQGSGGSGGSSAAGSGGSSAGGGTSGGGGTSFSGGSGGSSGGSGGFAGGSGGGAAGSGGGAGGLGGGGVGSAPPGAQSSGDTSHCSGGREFSPGIAYWAPPCVPGTPGAPDSANGGATGPGVTANQINIVDYNGDSGAEVDAILQAEGLYESYQNAIVLDKAYANFINKNFVLYGRKVNIITYQGQCTTVPPDTNCLIPEMDKIAAQYHPYALFWNTTLCSACFAELARDHVVAFGGVGFSDQFANANAPYFYSEGESSTRIEQAFAEFYCKQMASSPVKFAETLNPAQNFNGKPRVLGIISTNDADNEDTVKNVLVPLLKRTCGVTVNHFYFYAQDINTAAQQVAAGIAAMDTAVNPASVVLCLCDPVAPEFLYEGEKANNYYPENVLASDQGMDADKAAQAYETGLGCPGNSNCEFDLAFGIGPDGPQEPATNDAGTRIYALGGGTSLPVDPTVNMVVAQSYVMIANLIENTGPDLTAANMQARAPAMGAVGGGSTGQALLQFKPGDYGWEQDARVLYFDKTAKSSYNGTAGTFVTIEGNRFNLGQYPTMSEPPIPSRAN
jgi:hypothetical protein